MTKQPVYGNAAKVFHWMIVVLLAVQFPIGWLMPDIQSGLPPGSLMTLHITIGLIILTLIIVRFTWRLLHPVAPANTLPLWQRVMSESVHWLLYGLVFATAMTGWFFVSFRGWRVSLLFRSLLPMLTAPDPTASGLVSSCGIRQPVSDCSPPSASTLLRPSYMHLSSATGSWSACSPDHEHGSALWVFRSNDQNRWQAACGRCF